MARLDTFSRELQVMVSEVLSPEVRSALIADAAREALADAQATNREALGRDAPFETFVDSRPGAALETVNPDRGVIVFAFDVTPDVMEFIGRMLVLNSPVLTGRYQDSHRLFADGVEVERFDPALDAEEWVFLSALPYSRKIEAGLSDQAPDGVYEATAVMAQRRYGNVARITFGWSSPPTGGKGREAVRLAREARVPAITVRL